ncbi:hypothetical protein BD779DRAFT_1674025 [Infundibulicybe gibba]|nr:hypothetical protein BD779DRAFT_1674025 [Infundibulicybe gibba]
MSAITESNPPDPFHSHLVALLSIYELGPLSAPIPRYDGPSDLQTESILRSLASMAKRMYTAEESLATIEIVGTRKQRSVGATPPSATGQFTMPPQGTETEDGAEEFSDSKPSRKPDPLPMADAPHTSIDPSGAFTPNSVNAHCPTCGRSALSGLPPSSSAQWDKDAESSVSNASSPLVAPMGFDIEMSAAEELKLLRLQVQDVTRVCNAVAHGDLGQIVIVPVQGVVMVQFKDTVNTMVDRLGQFAREVTRVSLEVGTEGMLGGQAIVPDCEGTWRELTCAVNRLAANLTSQVRSIAQVTKAVTLGDLSQQIQVDARGEILDLKNRVNGMVARLRELAAEVTRVTIEVGSQGKLGGQAHVPGAEGVWFELVTNVNRTCSSLTDQVRSIAVVTTAVARGDLTQKIQIQVEGEMSTLKGTVNSMVDQLSAFASEVTRVALEVGTQGILGGQARVEGVQGTWADLTRNVNKMASDVTNQVRSVSEVTKAVALGDLERFIIVDLQGEMLELKETVNWMVAQLSTFANEVMRISLEVGTEGILGSQVSAFGVRGVWEDLTENVNLMAVNLANHSQAHSIAGTTKVATGGDPTKEIEADDQGEVLEPKEA